MARIFIDGFENGSLENWVVDNSTYISSAVVPGFKGLYSFYCVGEQSYNTYKTLTSPLTTMYISFKLNVAGSTKPYIVFFKDSGLSTIIASLIVNITSKKLEIRLGGSTGTLLCTSDTVITNGITYLIEILYIPLNSGGTFTLKINGVQEATYTGDTTAGLENVQRIHLGNVNNDGAAFYLDDLVIDDANWIGNTYVQKGQVSGAGTTTQFTPSAGANYQCVDEIPYSDADYNSSNTTGHIDTFAVAAMTGSIASIKAVQLEARIAYEGTPTPTHVQLGVRSGGTDYFDTDISPALSFGKVTKMLELNPNGDTAWLEATVNAMEIGYKVTA